MIEPIDIGNLDGHGNQSYRDENDVARLERQMAAMADKLNEAIAKLNEIEEWALRISNYAAGEVEKRGIRQ